MLRNRIHEITGLATARRVSALAPAGCGTWSAAAGAGNIPGIVLPRRRNKMGGLALASRGSALAPATCNSGSAAGAGNITGTMPRRRHELMPACRVGGSVPAAGGGIKGPAGAGDVSGVQVSALRRQPLTP